MVYKGINYSSWDLYTNLILRCLTLQVDTSGCRKYLGNQEIMGKTSSLYHPGNSVPSSGVSNGWKTYYKSTIITIPTCVESSRNGRSGTIMCCSPKIGMI